MGHLGPHERSKPLLRILLGEVLRRIRLEQRRTLADVSEAAKVSMPYLSELERGRKEASSEVLAAVCAALSIDLADLLAQVGRELAAADAPLAPVIRLHSIEGGRASRGEVRRIRPSGPASPTCLLAA
jgi:XRE family transcriptional regulator, stress-response regulator